MTTDSKASDVKPRKLTPKQARILYAVNYLQEYMRTYTAQRGYLDYSDKTFIDDVLYGLGVALDGAKHTGASGYDTFKEVLREHLGTARASQQPSAQWIACSERMPPDSGRVLAIERGEDEPCMALYFGRQSGWKLSGSAYELEDVTHWMPLPKAPDTARTQ